MSEISKQALAVENTTNFPNNNTGYITPALLRSFNTDLIDSTVNQIVYTANSASWNAQIDALEAFTASQQPSFTAINAFTASQLQINSGYNSFTQSANAELDSLSAWTGSWNTWTSSINEIRDDGVLQGYSTRFYFNGLVSASIVQNVGGPIANVTVEQDGTKLNTSSFNDYTASSAASQSVYSASQAAWNTSASSSIVALQNFSSSLDATFATDAQLTATASVLQTSIDTKLNTSSFNAYTQSVTQAGYATTGSNTFNGNQNILGAVKVIGDALSIQGNLAGSGSQYANAQLVIDNTTDPANVYSSFQGVDKNNNGVFGIGINSYNPKDGLAANFWMGGGKSVGGDNTILTANAATANLQFWKPETIFNSNVSVTGSTTLKNTTINGTTTINGGTTITGSFQTNGGAIFGNNTSQYNSLTVSSSLATYPGNLYNAIQIDTDGGGQWSAGMYISTYNSFGSQPAFGIFGGGLGNTGTNNILESYGNLLRFGKNTEITGSLTITGSVYQNVKGVSIASSTASIDLSVANYFTLTLAGDTKINVTNPRPGVTATLVVTVGAAATASFSSNVKQVSGSAYYASPSGSTDVISLTSVDSTNVYLVPAYSFV